jgi:hypothetical protein
MAKPRFIDDKTAALIGRIVVLEEQVAELIARVDQQERSSRGFGPGKLLSEPQAAELLNVSTRTLSRWRQSSRPPIPVMMREGFIRYRAEDVEKFIREGTRGAKAALRVA